MLPSFDMLRLTFVPHRLCNYVGAMARVNVCRPRPILRHVAVASIGAVLAQLSHRERCLTISHTVFRCRLLCNFKIQRLRQQWLQKNRHFILQNQRELVAGTETGGNQIGIRTNISSKKSTYEIPAHRNTVQRQLHPVPSIRSDEPAMTVASYL